MRTFLIRLQPAILAGLTLCAAFFFSSCKELERAMAESLAPEKTTGNIKVFLYPEEVTEAGARWRVDGGKWKKSRRRVMGLEPGIHEVSFRARSGWVAPDPMEVHVVGGKTARLHAAYALNSGAAGSLTVNISPDEANEARARWRVDGGRWKRSGAVVSDLTPGTHQVTFRKRSGWTRPDPLHAVVEANELATYEAAYTQSTGGVAIYIEPAPAVDEGAQWSIDGGPWNNPGIVWRDIATGEHEISFKPVEGWETPVSTTVSIQAGDVTVKQQNYVLALEDHIVIGYNDLGMHCMNEDFSDLMILPPFNTVHAQVIRRGKSPKILTERVRVDYSIPGNTTSFSKTNFWDYDVDLFGVDLPLDYGLTGNTLSGVLTPRHEEGDHVATGIPVTPIKDSGELDAYPLAKLVASQNGTQIARTSTVLPVSWEISCNLCHSPEDSSLTGDDILLDHDEMHGTNLIDQKPVVCGSCHAQAPLGLTGVPGVASLSSAMHSAHASRMGLVTLENNCYACHPGFETNCQRDVHFERGMNCTDCHGGMEAVGNPARRAWLDEPKCADCHQRPHFEFEEEGKLYRESRGHHEIQCAVCHGSPHAITPTVTAADNVQAIIHQGSPGVLECTVCHINRPEGDFEHHL